MTYDIVIIGSGLGALECALLLSRQGRSVIVLERQRQPGGCMQSYRRGALHFDTGLHYIGGIGEGQALHDAFERLGLLELPWRKLDDDAFDTVTIQGKTYRLASGYDNFAARLAERFPDEIAALRTYIDTLREIDYAPANQEAVTRWETVNAWQWLHELFRNERLIQVLSGTSLKLELRKDTLPLFTFAHSTASFIESSWRLQADGNVLVNRLADGIRQNGGQIICDAEVVELIEQNGCITAAKCADGETYEGRTFISNAHPTNTCSLVKQNATLKNLYRRRITQLPNTYGMFTVSLELKPGMQPYFNHNKYIYTTDNVWTLSEPQHDGDGVLVSVPVPAADDTSGFAMRMDLLSPMLWSECAKWADTTVGHRGDDYKDFKRRRAEQLIRLAETQLPSLADSIARAHTSTPLTYRDYNATPDGTAYGIRKDCTAPMLTILTPRTPIPNLYLTGQNLMVHGVQGVTRTAMLTVEAINSNV